LVSSSTLRFLDAGFEGRRVGAGGERVLERVGENEGAGLERFFAVGLFVFLTGLGSDEELEDSLVLLMLDIRY
jgi:hypothetical protein